MCGMCECGMCEWQDLVFRPENCGFKYLTYYVLLTSGPWVGGQIILNNKWK